MIEVRATGSGVISEVNAENGQTIKIHETLCSIDTSKSAPPQSAQVQKPEPSKTEKKPEAPKAEVSKIEVPKATESKASPPQPKHQHGTKVFEDFNDHSISSLRRLVNNNIKEIHSEKAILSTFNEVIHLFNNE